MSMQPPPYTRAQLQAFYAHIKLPEPWRYSSVSEMHAASSSDTQPAALVAARKAGGAAGAELALLERVMVHTLNVVPFENLSLHYNPFERVVLSPELILQKVVGGVNVDEMVLPVPAGTNNGEDLEVEAATKKIKSCRGGYCMENNLLFATILRTIGFHVRSCGGRVFDPAAGLTAWAHMVNLVLIGGVKYVVDIGFGSLGVVRPTPLPSKQLSVPASERIWPEHTNVSPCTVRFVRADPSSYYTKPEPAKNGAGENGSQEWPQEEADESLDLWVYEVKPAPSQNWIPGNCFAEIEFFPADYGVMSEAVSTQRRSWFTYRLVCMRFVLRGDVAKLCRIWRERRQEKDGEEPETLPYENEEEGAAAREGKEEDIVGQLVLTNSVKLRVEGVTRVLAPEFAKEADRIEALRVWFGIKLSREEQRGIACMVTAIGEPAIPF